MDTIKLIITKDYEHFFPNILLLLKTIALIPVTSATAERSFLVLRRLKTYLRSTMAKNQLNGLALSNIHKEIDINPEEIAEIFCKLKNRRMSNANWDVEDP